MYYKKVLIAFLLNFVSIHDLYASSEGSNQPGTIMMAIMEQVPYGFQDKDGQKTGVLYETGELIKKEGKLSINIVSTPAMRIIHFMNSEQKTCTLVADTPDIKGVYDLVEPIGFSVGAGILPVSGIKLNDYSSLRNISIAVPSGIQFDEKFHNDDSLNKIEVPEYLNGVKMLEVGRVDAVAGAIPSLKYSAKLLGLNKEHFGKPLMFFEFDFFLVCNKYVEAMERMHLKSLVNSLRESGKIEQIFNRYFTLESE